MTSNENSSRTVPLEPPWVSAPQLPPSWPLAAPDLTSGSGMEACRRPTTRGCWPRQPWNLLLFMALPVAGRDARDHRVGDAVLARRGERPAPGWVTKVGHWVTAVGPVWVFATGSICLSLPWFR